MTWWEAVLLFVALLALAEWNLIAWCRRREAGAAGGAAPQGAGGWTGRRERGGNGERQA